MENVSYLVTKEFTVQNTTYSWEKTTLSYEAYYVCWFQTSAYEEYITYLGMMCFVNPAVSFVGLICNMISLAILRRSGLHKPSNILLFGLVIADSMCLSTTLNYGIILFYFGPNKPFSRLCSFQYVDSLNVYLAVTSIIMEFIGFWGQYVNTWIPILITLERLLAIFKPMTFKSIVTRKRAIASVLFCFSFWFPWQLYFSQLLKIVVRSYQYQKYVLVGYVSFSDLMLKNFIEAAVLENFKSFIPIIFISLGCSCIFIKIAITLRNRTKLSTSYNPRRSSTRTTRTLMLTCVIFVITQVIHIAAVFAYTSPYEMHYLVRNEFINLCNNINASSNLVVYVTSNKKLYKIFVQFFCLQHSSKNRNIEE